jgi:hypothetical protein
MPPIRQHFRCRLDAVQLRGVGATQPAKLRKHEPHPMGSLCACLELREDVIEDRSLGLDEPLKGVCRCANHSLHTGTYDKGSIKHRPQRAWKLCLKERFAVPRESSSSHTFKSTVRRRPMRC